MTARRVELGQSAGGVDTIDVERKGELLEVTIKGWDPCSFDMTSQQARELVTAIAESFSETTWASALLGRRIAVGGPFLVAICPCCRVPWPSYTRDDLRLMPHERVAREGEAPTRHTPHRIPLVRCEGSDGVLDAGEYGENGDPRFDPPAIVQPWRKG